MNETTRVPRVSSPGPGPGAGMDRDPDRAAMLNARIALVAVIVVTQLWALTVALNSWLEGHAGHVYVVLGFQAFAFAASLAVWLVRSKSSIR